VLETCGGLYQASGTGVVEELLIATQPKLSHGIALLLTDGFHATPGATRDFRHGEALGGIYLKAGPGQPQWSAFALALYNMGNPNPLQTLPGLRRPGEQLASPYQWVRDNYVLIRFAGNTGSFDQVSYIDVLQGRVSPQLLRGAGY
jgi:hypothetical protein